MAEFSSPDYQPLTLRRANTSLSESKRTIVGIYGLPGSGKTTLINELKYRDLNKRPVCFYEGSDEINSVCAGGLEVFKQLGKDK